MPQSIQELRDKLSHKTMSAQDIVDRAEKENRILTADEQKLFDAACTEAEEIKAEIKHIEEHEKRAKEAKRRMEELNAFQPRQSQPTQPATDPEPEPRIAVKSYGARFGKLKAFKNERDAYLSGAWYLASFHNSFKAQRICSENGIPYGSNYRNALSEGTNSAGGYLVPDEFSQAIIDLRESYGVFRRYARIVPMGRDTLHIARRQSGVTASFVGENPSSSSTSDPAWDGVQLTAKKLSVTTLFSTELDEDAMISIADNLAGEFAYAFALKEDQCGFIGDGSSTYGGIVGVQTKFNNDLTLVGAVDVANATHDLFSEIDQTDLATLMGTLPQYARMNAKWFCSQACADIVFGRLMASAGGNTIQTLQGDYRPSYLGHEIVVSQVLNSTLTANDNTTMLLFGDLSMAATIGERRGITVSRTNDRYWELDQIGLKATERLDIVVHDVGDGTNAGPIVALIGSTS